MFCTQCGANNADTAAVCAQCGRGLQPGALATTPSQPTGVVLPPGTTVQNYLKFVTSKGQGQALLPGDDYLGLPKDVIKKAEAGAAKANF